MIRRPFLVAAAFALSALVLFGALARITAMTLALEKSEVAARERATHEENVRIALWRIDATLAELIALENTRSAVRFRSAAEPAGLLPLAGAAVATESGTTRPDLTPLVRVRFEVGADRKLRAEPALPAPAWLAALPIPEQPPLAAPRPSRPAPRTRVEPVIAAAAEPPKERESPPPVSPPATANAAAPATQQNSARNVSQNSTQNVAQGPVPQKDQQSSNKAPVQQASPPTAEQHQQAGETELEKIPAARDPWAVLQATPGVLTDRINVGGNESGQQSVYSQEALNTLSFKRRQELGRQSNLVRPASAPAGVEVESAFETRWMQGDLLLMRRVRRGDARLLQGTWLDWPALRTLLLRQVEAVVPASRLEPVGEADDTEPGRRLALLPARLVPGPMLETEPQDWTPVRLSIAAAWVAAFLGLIGVGSLLKSSVTLSQRRADFVSAVTHELRTPLTTFRLYTDMLLEGIVSAEERPSYLSTLKLEADRLGHLVANVLAFSRLEQRAAATRLETLTLTDLLARTVPHLEERAAQAGLSLQVETARELAEERVRVDLACAEQILLNLVDNACKYASNPADPTLRLATALQGRYVLLQLQDHGPGIERSERRRIFRPFHRSASRAAGSAPGVGLGLALSRRLARRMGGDLRLAGSVEGARFEVWLRREH